MHAKATKADVAAAARVLASVETERWSSPWVPPTEERDAIGVHPIVITELRRLLMDEPKLRGVGYSVFIMRAIRQWQADHA